MAHQTLVVRRRAGNRGCGIYRSSSGMLANQAGNLSPNRRLRLVENEHGTFGIHNYRKPFSAGANKVESVGRKIPGNG